MYKKLWHHCWQTVAIFIVLAAVVLSGVRALTPLLSHYNQVIADHASTVVGKQVHIQGIRAGWYHFKPVLKLRGVDILAQNGEPLLHIGRLEIGINFLNSLRHWRIEPGVIVVNGANIEVEHERSGNWRVAGLPIQHVAQDDESAEHLLEWLFAQKALVFKQINIHWRSPDGSVIPMNNLNLKLTHSKNQLHELYAETQLSQTVPSHFKLMAQFHGGNHPKNWLGKFYVSADDMLLSQWLANRSVQGIRIKHGAVGVQLWGEFADGHIKSVQSSIDVNNVHWSPSVGLAKIIQQFKANLYWQKQIDGWELTADKIHLRIGGHSWPENAMRLKYQPSQGYTLSVGYVDIDDSIGMLKNLKPEFKDYTLSGTLTNLNATFNESSLKHLQANLNQVGLTWPKQLKVDNIAGFINFIPNTRLSIDLASKQLALDMPSVFSNKPPAFDAKGRVEVQLDRPKPLIKVKNLQINNQTLQAHTQLDLDLAANTINLHTALQVANASGLKAYLPDKKISKRLHQWVGDAIKAGTLDGQLVWDGSLNEPKQIRFDAVIGAGELQFLPDWPRLSAIEGKLTIADDALHTVVQSATTHGVVVKNLQIKIPKLIRGKSHVLVQGPISTDSQRMHDYLKHTRLYPKLKMLSKVAICGEAILNLDVDVNLTPKSKDYVKATLRLKNNQFAFQSQPINMQGLTGQLQISETGIYGGHLEGRWQAHPVSLNFSRHKDKLSIDFASTVNLKDYTRDLTTFAKGQSPFKGRLLLQSQDSGSVELRSNLEGISFKLPKPFAKLAQQKAPLTLKAKIANNKLESIDFNYANRLAGFFALDAGVIERGELRLGSGRALRPNQPGLQIIGQLQSPDIQSWQRFIGQVTALPRQLPLAPHLDLQLNGVNLLGQQFNKLNLSAKPLENHTWQISVKHPQLYGKINIPKDLSLGLTAQFDKLIIADASSSHSSMELSPASLPPLDIVVSDFRYGTKQFGQMVLQTEPGDGRLTIKKLTVNNPYYTIDTTGYWSRTASQSDKTFLHGYTATKKLGNTLQAWGIPPALDSKTAQLSFELTWPSKPADISMKQMTGTLNLKLLKGRITNLSKNTEDKIGIGKLLSILSLQTLPRRIRLDFSDLSKSGFSFDELTGHFIVTDGNARTQDLVLNGPVAYIKMQGGLDLGKQSYDLRLRVAPHITASLPLVATIAGGPVVGAIAWVADKIISRNIVRKVIAYSYEISGPWQAPVVKSTHITAKRKNGKSEIIQG